ncbi:MAG: 8-amino-7-oxononanoate synthase [Gammaproteobacteria bacterium]|nr:8-amino-7-oxononanoate synthase [Gammaproteobacteria bacterium]NND39721.1 8-amino-7-oxononanoate synthase [Pseudomonadales bacterium]RZV59524.1 MAG: 8-amino-7-oxononanoate synthase [Pseudomonadales bacterium]
MSKWLERLTHQLEQNAAQHLQRERFCTSTPQASSIVVDGERLDNFSSNDYLGFANHPEVVGAFRDAASRFGVGGGASHLVCGHSILHQQLEVALAEYTGRDRALLFGSGYMANMAVLTTLAGRGDSIFQDKLNHASLIDGGLASGAAHYRYRHKDLQHLAALLAGRRKGQPMIVTDAVFSMDGDCAPLAALAAYAAAQDAILIADDAHGFGVLGEHGAGLAEKLQLDQQALPVLIATLGKAYGVQGAFVAGSEALIETLLQTARQYIYTTAMPPASAAAVLAGLELNLREPQRRQHLQSLVQHFKRGCQSLGLPLLHNDGEDTPIQPLLVGDNVTALRIAQELRRRNILAVAIRPPTVPRGTARLRISFSAAHSIEQVDRLLDALAQGFALFAEPAA